MLIIAKTPAPVSVEAGHYFQGAQGRMFWNSLCDYRILTRPTDNYHDELLLNHGYGITDIAKVPRDFGDEPSDREYLAGTERILKLIKTMQPTVLMFVYKRVLDRMLSLALNHPGKSKYGLNPDLDRKLGSRVFIFPMPGTPCTKAEAQSAMTQLSRIFNSD